MQIRLLTSSDQARWDAYVYNDPDSTHCHLSGWKRIIENTYGHQAYYFLAEADSSIVGVLPLFHLKSLIFGNHLVSMPFLDCGGVLGDSREVNRAIVQRAVELGSELKTSIIELRQANHLNIFEQDSNLWLPEERNRVRLVLQLPASSVELFRSCKAKLRSQIRRPQKEGMRAVLGGSELLGQFYDVFSMNMRDLGSPVHSMKLFSEVCKHLKARISVVYHGDKPIAAGLMILFRDTAEIPWASSLKKYNKLSPNMLLYWSLLAYACDHGFRSFSFGRSTAGGGTYKFKQQWGADAVPLQWQYWSKNGSVRAGIDSQSAKFLIAAQFWQRLPRPVTLWFGPMVRKYISL